MLTYAHVCSRMAGLRRDERVGHADALTYALTYADVCWRMAGLRRDELVGHADAQAVFERRLRGALLLLPHPPFLRAYCCCAGVSSRDY